MAGWRTAGSNGSTLRSRSPGKHYRTIAVLPLILGSQVEELARFLDACRTKRHEVTYESVTTISDEEAQELIEAVQQLQEVVRRYLDS